MNNTTEARCAWLATVTLADTRRIYVGLSQVAGIVGSAYGTAMCDRALRTHTAVSTVSVLLKDRLVDCGGDPSHGRASGSPSAAGDRDALRTRAGEQPLRAGPAFRHRRLHPLARREHELLGDDLKAMQRTLAAIEAECGEWRDVQRAVHVALRSLLALCSRLEAAARREHPAKPVAPLYFGSDAP